MAGPPELSIIVVNWNTREMTLACLRSVYAETRSTPFELIVVDNGSHDGSAEAIAAEFPGVRLIVESVNHGFARANNLAAQGARGDYILLLNSDTVVLDRAIDRLVEFARGHPSAKIWGGRTVFADGSVNIGSAWGRLTGWGAVVYATGLSRLLWRVPIFDPEGLRAWDRSSEREVDIVSGCFLLVERAFWNELGGFDPAFFMYAEEAELCARARASGARPRVTPAAAIVHHGGGSAVEQHATLAALFGGKIRLAAKHLPRVEAGVVRLSYLFAAGSRALAYSARATIDARQRPRAETWRRLWTSRQEWANPASDEG
jgi:GT2 family glycosyltransferase